MRHCFALINQIMKYNLLFIIFLNQPVIISVTPNVHALIGFCDEKSASLKARNSI
jgi:hypothetical protein